MYKVVASSDYQSTLKATSLMITPTTVVTPGATKTIPVSLPVNDMVSHDFVHSFKPDGG